MLDTIQWPIQNEKCVIVLNKKCPYLHVGSVYIYIYVCVCVCVYVCVCVLKIQKWQHQDYLWHKLISKELIYFSLSQAESCQSVNRSDTYTETLADTQSLLQLSTY